MKRTLILTVVVTLAACVLMGMGRTKSNAVKVCRADAQRFGEENASYEAEYDSLYGATTLVQRPIRELLDRDDELMSCIATDPSQSEQYKAVLYRKGFVEGNRFFAYMLDKKEFEDFRDWERGQQQTQLAKYDH